MINEHTMDLDAREQQVTDLQDRNRHSNLHLLGLPEGAEKDDPIGFLKRSLPIWIPSLAAEISKLNVRIEFTPELQGITPNRECFSSDCYATMTGI